MGSKYRSVDVTISSGTPVSGAASVIDSGRSFEPSAVILDGTYTNTSFDLQARYDGTWYNLYDVFGSVININVADGKHSIPADSAKDVDEIRVASPDSTNEASDRTVTFLFVELS